LLEIKKNSPVAGWPDLGHIFCDSHFLGQTAGVDKRAIRMMPEDPSLPPGHLTELVFVCNDAQISFDFAA